MLDKIILSLVVSLSLTPLDTNYYAKDDLSSNASYVGSATGLKVDEVNKSIADKYSLSIYVEETLDELVPLELLNTSAYISVPTKLTYTIENVSTTIYESSLLVEAGLNFTSGAKIEIPFVSELQNEISLNAGVEYGQSLSTETQDINVQSFEVEVDGVKNKFGIYVFAHCAVSAYKFYFKYNHYRIANYDQMEMYQTMLLHENTDCHVYLPLNPSRNVNTIFYFETLSDYNDFCEKWGF